MSNPISSSASLPIAHIVLRLLIVLNWAMGVAILVLLLLFFFVWWFFVVFHLSNSPDASHVVMGLRVVAVLGLVGIPLNFVVLKRLLSIIETVRVGDPFVSVNAQRLQSIAWALCGLQILSMLIGGIGRVISSPAHPGHLRAGFSVYGWLAVLLTF